MLSQSKWSIVSSLVRTLSTTSRIGASHYDVLGVTPKATQSDIKSAYYNLSKVYHPDRSKDEESAKKFRSIKEAYEVLGNVNLKKMYDRGLLVGTENTTRVDYQPEPEPSDPNLKFYKSRTNRNVIPTMDGKTPIYDFDSWAKNHYGTLFERAKYEKEFTRKKHQKLEEASANRKQETFMYVMFALTALFVALAVNGTADYDQDRTVQNNNTKNNNSK